MATSPTAGFSLSALPTSINVKDQLGMDYSPNIRAGFTGGLKSYQDAMSVGPQTKAIIAKAKYEQAADEQKGRLLAPEEEVLIQEYRNKKGQGLLTGRSIEALASLKPYSMGSNEQFARDQALGAGATARGMADKGFRNIAEPGMPPLIQTPSGITQGYPAAFMNKGMPGSISTMEVGSAPDNTQTGEAMVYVQQYSANALGQLIPIGGKTLITKSSLAALQASNQSLAAQPSPVATAAPAPAAAPVAAPVAGASSLGSFAAPPAVTSPSVNAVVAPAATPAVTSPVDGTAGTPIATPAATPVATSLPPAPPVQANPAVNQTTPNNPPFVQGFGYLNRNQDTVFGPGKNVEDATKRAIAGGYPAVAPNINWQATPGVANSNELSARNRAAKEMENVGATISDLQKAKDLIGRELNVGENVTTFAKLPLIGGIFNDFRRLFQPDIVALENLAKQAGMGQAKNLVGGRVAVQEMTQIVGALGDANVTQEVRKELAMAYLIGNQNQLDYLRAKEKYVNAFKVVDGFDDRWTEYSMDNPIGNGVPGENYQINENRIPWSLYNVLKNKGYANPNEIASKNEDLVNRETGTFNYNALPNGPDGPWAPSNTLPAAAISNPANPVSGKSSNAASKPQDLKSFIDLNLRGPDGKIRSREDILKLFNEATGGK